MSLLGTLDAQIILSGPCAPFRLCLDGSEDVSPSFAVNICLEKSFLPACQPVSASILGRTVAGCAASSIAFAATTITPSRVWVTSTVATTLTDRTSLRQV